ncbi:hypothetical protein LF1_25370 [Rubripirellula obstinata]|uniref:Prepilin-type N-terminal cleavage/methylation domain-containing protein n=1 Tax=Rubripirellula obstinata TaxID=406547 RepID=A0A5B1CJV8_9BACT|nr:prepilin-type N-terminal cleavage/methylation domain-containing protein [Rubripirellula obstinata]KAA1259999.1 hypothetical protein LF1_25370 [Rubripirellula obstinata]
MNHSSDNADQDRPGNRRDGISLIEVIACMAIVGIMMVPISSVMRSSRQAVTHAESRSPETDLRDGSRWLRRLIQDNTLVETHSDVVVLKLNTGDYVKIYATNDELVMDNGKEAVVLMTDVLGAEFGEIKQATAPGNVIGVKMAIYVLDPTTGNKKNLTSVVSIPTQF